MLKISTMTVKIKESKTIKEWFAIQSKKAAELYNHCLDLQFDKINKCEKINSAFDLSNYFRDFPLASDYKDKIFERVAKSTSNWLKSEPLRYLIYWQHAENRDKNTNWKSDYHKHVARLTRKQKIFGRPHKRKKCSLAFSIRKNRQSTIIIKKNKLLISIPKFKGILSGKYNFLVNDSAEFKIATLKKDNCGTLWLRLTAEEELKSEQEQNENLKIKDPKVIVGVDMGLKTTRSAVAVDVLTKKIIEVYQPQRQRYFDQSYNALVWASNKDRRHLPFVHRKIARRRLDNIGKDIVKILNMGDELKFGKPGSAFLLSGRLARSASDAANSLFLTRFAKRAELAGKKSGEVNERETSVTCRICAYKKLMPLKIRMYECGICGHTEDRDVNSAYQIAFREFLEEDSQGYSVKKLKNGKLLGREMKPEN